jgi:polyisoprenoid-binding protein YceI
MPQFSRIAVIAVTLFLAACSKAAPEATPLDGDWTLDGEASRLSYVSVKAGDIAEVNRFAELSGSVSANGVAAIEIELASVSTGIDIRDGRMRDVLFNVAQNPFATVTAQIDPKDLDGLKIGDSTIQPVEAVVKLKGIESSVYADLEVTRIANDKVVVATTEPIILDANSFDLGDGLAQLRDLASLPSISTAVPVTFSFSFER